MVQLLTPVVKAFLTDEGFNNANAGLQVLGGAGFTTDWPLEQLVRDGRIPRIYEGTNGIQAMDLVGRKLGLGGGRLVAGVFELLENYTRDNAGAPHVGEVAAALATLRSATDRIATHGLEDPEQAGAAATPYLRLVALVVIGYLWSRMAAAAQSGLEESGGYEPLLEGKLVSARYYFDKVLPEIDWLVKDISSGKQSMMALSDDQWVV